MALKIRLRQQGKKNRQTYRLVVMDIRAKRDGKYLEKLGWYDPYREEQNCMVDDQRVSFWLSQGAEISTRAEQIVRRGAPDLYQQYQLQRQQQRIKRQQKRRGIKQGTKA
jgi:small subunit ribosomal protein S16